MSYPTSTFQRSDSQSGLYARTHTHAQQQGSSASTSQQGQQHQSSRPRFESRSSSISTANQSRLSLFYGNDANDNSLSDEIYSSRESIKQIKQKIQSIRCNNDFDIEGLIDLFKQIKVAQKKGDLACIRQHEPALLAGLSDPLSQLIKKIDDQLASGADLVTSFNAEDIHAVFNGFSVIIGESVSDSLLSELHFNRVRYSLRHITEGLIKRAINKGFLQKQWDSSSLLNALNWLSRGLKRNLLSEKIWILKCAFTQALMLMKDWSTSTDETATATTLIAPLDTRQLGKCMVQVGTALKFNLVTEEGPDHLLRDVVLGLCGGKALAQFTLWSRGANGNQSGCELTQVLPEGAEITNISNTIKDCLLAGILRLDDGQVQSIVNSLCRQMNVTSERNFLERRGQRMGNFCNFLREIFEVEYAAKKLILVDRTEYDRACNRLLDQMSKISPVVSLDAQSISNQFSFVKAMDRSRRQPTELLRSAASKLMTHLRTVIGEKNTVENIAGILGGLHHLALRGLIKRGPAVDQMISLINEIVLNDLDQWPAKSRVALTQATVHCWQDMTSRKTPLQPHFLLEMMQKLLTFPDAVAKKYTYLMAAVVLIRQDVRWLANHQIILKRLLPAKAGVLISEDDVLQTLEKLKASEPVVEKLPELEITNSTTTTNETTTSATTIITATMTTAQASVVNNSPQQVTVGMTRVISSPNNSIDTTNTATVKNKNAAKPNTATAARTSTTTTTSSAERTTLNPVVPPTGESTVTSFDEYQIPKRVAKAKQGQITPLRATDPVLKVRDTSSSVRASAHNNKPLPEKKANIGKSLSPTSKNQIKSAPKEVLVSKPAKQTPEQEWFHLLKHEGALSTLQLRRLQELLEKTPSLAISAEGKGDKARTALFYALSTGKAEAVGLIMRANSQVKRDVYSTLRQVFDEVLIVGDSEARALKICLSMLSESELAALRDALNQRYKSGEMRKVIAGNLVNVLSEKGLVPKENAGIDNKFETQSNGKKKKISKHANNVTSKNLNPDPVDNVDVDGFNALMIAAENGNTNEFIPLIFHDSGIEQMRAVSKRRWNALMLAAYGGHTDIVKLIMHHPLRIEQLGATQRQGMNALMIAAQRGHAAVVELLMKHGSDVEQLKTVDDHGFNALMSAARLGHANVVDVIINYKAGAEQIMAVNTDEYTALMIAAEHGCVDVVDVLIHHKSGAEQSKVVSREKCNSLMLAAIHGHSAVVDLLLLNDLDGEQIMARQTDGLNALMLAAFYGKTDVVKIFIKHGSVKKQLTVTSNMGLNALQLATLKGNTDIVDLLLPFDVMSL